MTFSKTNFSLKKKIRAEGFTWKKIPAQAVSEKKNSCKLKIPLPPHHFSNGPSLSVIRSGVKLNCCPSDRRQNFLIRGNYLPVANEPTSFPGSSLYLEKVPWLRLVTCLLDFSRFQRCDWKDRGWKFQVCLHWAYLLSPVGSEICNPPILDRQNSQRGHWHIQYWSSMHSMLA